MLTVIGWSIKYMNINIKDGKKYTDISNLKNWNKNPRSITPKGFERLKKQITKLGQYKPLLITEDGTVLGGNMRLKAYQDMGIKDIWVSIVDAPTEEKKIEYALSDNDRVGRYNSEQIANMVGNFPEIAWDEFSIDLDEPLIVQDLIDNYNFDPNKEWEGMPKFEQEGTEFYKMLIIRFLTKEDYDSFSKIIGQKITEKTKSIWYPQQDFDSLGRKIAFKKENDS